MALVLAPIVVSVYAPHGLVSAVSVSIALMLSFALWVTVHCLLAFGLIRHGDRGWWLLLLLVPPALFVAPYWGWKAGLKARSVVWTALLTAYLALLLLGAAWRA